MRIDRITYQQFVEKPRHPQLKQLKFKKNNLSSSKLNGKNIKIMKYEELEYVHSSEGRCMSQRSRGKMSSLLIRNCKYGVETRIFLFNPRVTLQYKKIYKQKRIKNSTSTL